MLQYHEDIDATRHCALSRVVRWTFLLADHFCEPLGVQLIAGTHLPQNADVPSSLSVKTSSEDESVVSSYIRSHWKFFKFSINFIRSFIFIRKNQKRPPPTRMLIQNLKIIRWHARLIVTFAAQTQRWIMKFNRFVHHRRQAMRPALKTVRKIDHHVLLWLPTPFTANQIQAHSTMLKIQSKLYYMTFHSTIKKSIH